MSQEQLLNEYQAAVLVGLSPRLLRWFTKHAPKQDDPRKLEVAKTEKGTIFFKEQELLSFNEWLKTPWPHKEKKRPPIPSGILDEIKTEANGECAICNSHKDTCQGAHIDPISKSKNNHPENLLWLCSNHHIAYDNGLFGPDSENKEFVVGFKVALSRHKRMLWNLQDEVSRKLFYYLDECDRLAEQFKVARTPQQIKAIKKVADETLALIPALGPISSKDPNYVAYKAIAPSLSSLDQNEERTISSRLGEAQRIRKRYVAALGFVACPLCHASGNFRGSDCPLCYGDREITEKLAESIDLGQYEIVKCPLCKGSGRFDSDDCPECGGEGEMPVRYADEIDLSKYEKVKCPLCKGRGRFESGDCPECGGEGEMASRYADEVDLSRYEKVDCPLCGGKGSFRGDDCPFCDAEKKVTQRAFDDFDGSYYG